MPEKDVLPSRSHFSMGLQDWTSAIPQHLVRRGWLLMVQCCINTWVVSLMADGTGEEGVKTIEFNMLDLSDLDQFWSLPDSFIFHIILSLAGKWHTWSSVSHLNFLKENVGVFCIFPFWSWWQTKEEAFRYLFLNSPEIFQVRQLLLKNFPCCSYNALTWFTVLVKQW